MKPFFLFSTMENLETLARLEELNNQGDFILFKHSPRCSISNMAYDRYQRFIEALPAGVKTYVVNVLTSRDISQFIAGKYGVQHESPQVLYIRNGTCIYNASHSLIDPRLVAESVTAS
ncbi:MAG: bacillithiol system redox-active protein YtxJ [Bacteroidia bacterium]|nr:bacillithiol system redox-active protein YtxJ [Bacteroidia bacterium]